MRKTKYDWKKIQEDYDAGLSQRDLRVAHGVHFKTISAAIKRGDFQSRSVDTAMALAGKQGKLSCVHSEDFKRSVSMRQSLKNSGGRCKWFEVEGQRVQGTWERDAAIKFEYLKVEWRKCGGKSDIIWYELDGKKRAYTPDFYLPAFGIYLELKGYWWGDDKRKMEAVCAQTNKRIVIFEKQLFEKLLESDDLTWILLL